MRPSEPIPINDVSCTTSMPTQLVTAFPHTVNASGVQATTKDFSECGFCIFLPSARRLVEVCLR